MAGVVVAEVMTDAEAELVAGYLRSRGVPAVVQVAEHLEGSAAAIRRARVLVTDDRAEAARTLLLATEHVDPRDTGSPLDVGLPEDEDVRDYLAWRAGQRDDDSDEDAAAPGVGPTPYAGPVAEAPRAGRAPLLPVLALAALFVVAVVLLSR